MISNVYTTSGNRRIEQAPSGFNESQTTGVLSVSLAEDEEVEWSWFHGNNCSYVYGYTIKKKS